MLDTYFIETKGHLYLTCSTTEIILWGGQVFARQILEHKTDSRTEHQLYETCVDSEKIWWILKSLQTYITSGQFSILDPDSVERQFYLDHGWGRTIGTVLNKLRSSFQSGRECHSGCQDNESASIKKETAIAFKTTRIIFLFFC